jgi:carbamoyl-phosphate synthase large subunit
LIPPINVLMTGAGAPGAAGIIKCLQQEPAIKLLVADADSSCVGRHLNPDFVQIPMGSDNNFIEKVVAVCEEKNIQVVMPLVTRELFPLAANRDSLKKKGIHILVSSANAISIANNKAKTYTFLQSKGIPVPQFHSAGSIEEFKKAAHRLGYPNSTFCFKPSVANGSRGFRIISINIDEWDLLFNHKPNNAFITYEDAVRILSSHPFPQLLVTEFLPGEEYSIDCLANEGEARVIIPRRRSKMINGISVQGEFVKDDEIIQYCRTIIKAIGLHGNIGIQVKRNKEGKPLLLEINPRVQGTIVAALGAGVNLPILALKQELNLAIDPAELNIRWGTQFFRYWTEIFYQ